MTDKPTYDDDNLPTWATIADNTIEHLDNAGYQLSEARDWMNSDWANGHNPTDGDARIEAARLIREAKSLIHQAKDAVRRSAYSDDN